MPQDDKDPYRGRRSKREEEQRWQQDQQLPWQLQQQLQQLQLQQLQQLQNSFPPPFPSRPNCVEYFPDSGIAAREEHSRPKQSRPWEPTAHGPAAHQGNPRHDVFQPRHAQNLPGAQPQQQQQQQQLQKPKRKQKQQEQHSQQHGQRQRSAENGWASSVESPMAAAPLSVSSSVLGAGATAQSAGEETPALAASCLAVSSSSPSCPAINKQVIAASETNNITHLLSTIERHLPRMNLVNVSTSMHRLAKVVAQHPSSSVGGGAWSRSGEQPASQQWLQRAPTLLKLRGAALMALRAASQDPALPQALSNIVWSLATMRLVDGALLQTASPLGVARIAQFKYYELSSLLWAYAKLLGGGVGSASGAIVGVGTTSGADAAAATQLSAAQAAMRPLFQSAASYLSEQRGLNGVQFRSLATIAWAFATARQHSNRLFRGLAAAMTSAIETANSQEIANSAWAFGTVGYREDRLLAALAQAALDRLQDFKPQEISNTLWGFATNSFYHEQFFQAALSAAVSGGASATGRGSSCGPSGGQGGGSWELQSQHLANILWAVARLRPWHPVTRQAALALLPRCTLLLRNFKPQEASSTALAVGKIFGAASTATAATCCNAGVGLLDLLGDETGGNSLSSWGSLETYQTVGLGMDALPAGANSLGSEPLHPHVLAFVAALAPWAVERIRDFSEQSLANLVTGMAQLDLVDTNFDADSVYGEASSVPARACISASSSSSVVTAATRLVQCIEQEVLQRLMQRSLQPASLILLLRAFLAIIASSNRGGQTATLGSSAEMQTQKVALGQAGLAQLAGRILTLLPTLQAQDLRVLSRLLALQGVDNLPLGAGAPANSHLLGGDQHHGDQASQPSNSGNVVAGFASEAGAENNSLLGGSSMLGSSAPSGGLHLVEQQKQEQHHPGQWGHGGLMGNGLEQLLLLAAGAPGTTGTIAPTSTWPLTQQPQHDSADSHQGEEVEGHLSAPVSDSSSWTARPLAAPAVGSGEPWSQLHFAQPQGSASRHQQVISIGHSNNMMPVQISSSLHPSLWDGLGLDFATATAAATKLDQDHQQWTQQRQEHRAATAARSAPMKFQSFPFGVGTLAYDKSAEEIEDVEEGREERKGRGRWDLPQRPQKSKEATKQEVCNGVDKQEQWRPQHQNDEEKEEDRERGVDACNADEGEEDPDEEEAEEEEGEGDDDEDEDIQEEEKDVINLAALSPLDARCTVKNTFIETPEDEEVQSRRLRAATFFSEPPRMRHQQLQQQQPGLTVSGDTPADSLLGLFPGLPHQQQGPAGTTLTEVSQGSAGCLPHPGPAPGLAGLGLGDLLRSVGNGKVEVEVVDQTGMLGQSKPREEISFSTASSSSTSMPLPKLLPGNGKDEHSDGRSRVDSKADSNDWQDFWRKCMIAGGVGTPLLGSGNNSKQQEHVQGINGHQSQPRKQEKHQQSNPCGGEAEAMGGANHQRHQWQQSLWQEPLLVQPPQPQPLVLQHHLLQSQQHHMAQEVTDVEVRRRLGGDVATE